jgi:hypothetical protein
MNGAMLAFINIIFIVSKITGQNLGLLLCLLISHTNKYRHCFRYNHQLNTFPAAIAGPVSGKKDAMMDVNYIAPIAAARACEHLRFGHWIQSSTQATYAERGGQVRLLKK